MAVQLRPFTRDDVAILERFAVDPEAAGPFNWTGFRNPNAPMERFEDNGLLGDDASHLMVVSGDDAVGAVQWRPAPYGGLIPGSAWTIGCTLLPHARVAVLALRHTRRSSTTCSQPQRPFASRPIRRPTTRQSAAVWNGSASSRRARSATQRSVTAGGAPSFATACCAKTIVPDTRGSRGPPTVGVRRTLATRSAWCV